MFEELFDSSNIKNARNKRKQFIENLKNNINADEKEYSDKKEFEKDSEALRRDWEKIGKDFPIR